MKRRIALLVLTVLLLLLQYRVWLGDGGKRERNALAAQLSEQRALVDKLSARNAALQAEVDDLKAGQAAIEARARGDLGMVMPGEDFYQLSPGLGAATSAPVASSPQP